MSERIQNVDAEIREDDGDPDVANTETVTVGSEGYADVIHLFPRDTLTVTGKDGKRIFIDCQERLTEASGSSLDVSILDRAAAIKDLIVGERLVVSSFFEYDGSIDEAEVKDRFAEMFYAEFRRSANQMHQDNLDPVLLYPPWSSLGEHCKAANRAAAAKVMQHLRMYWMSNAEERIALLLSTQDEQTHRDIKARLRRETRHRERVLVGVDALQDVASDFCRRMKRWKFAAELAIGFAVGLLVVLFWLLAR